MKSPFSFSILLKFSNLLQRAESCRINSYPGYSFSTRNSNNITLQYCGLRLFHSTRKAPNLRNETHMARSAARNNIPVSIFSRYFKNLLTVPGINSKLFSNSSCLLIVDKSVSAPLTKRQAQDLILRLTGEERNALLCALQEFQSEKMKAEYEAEAVPPPSSTELWQVAIHNALPFVGFGFLDNFFMILAGDYIEVTMGTMMVLSTMAAAALGNTISDILGIGSAWYVERVAARVGVRAPKLTPVQLDMSSSRWAANIGRVFGVTLGCLLGMTPLLFLNKQPSSPSQQQQDAEPT
ncbi:transmembrane protein 65 isoform X2 [Schistocerca americana]|uniref:transmembrane protein 65 isoform X2 n=1 Tax=Schistocerca americana TaxID=7009 RepID=UPI001F4FF9C6|nr:transmembrane protein 65 isoform X2 [Schistocerca americana]XP_049956624.1 transmembrane protein 65 isoform X2 [Schistocerca serialis cubense]